MAPVPQIRQPDQRFHEALWRHHVLVLVPLLLAFLALLQHRRLQDGRFLHVRSIRLFDAREEDALQLPGLQELVHSDVFAECHEAHHAQVESGVSGRVILINALQLVEAFVNDLLRRLQLLRQRVHKVFIDVLDALHGNIGEEGLLLCLAVVEYLNGLIIRGPHFDEPRQQIGLAVVAQIRPGTARVHHHTEAGGEGVRLPIGRQRVPRQLRLQLLLVLRAPAVPELARQATDLLLLVHP
mmetsp:Transcript_76234/g.128117  ORF Transcript_76234/g.128117 Transcript_76234/m.128117 type:complete len:240 (-) Transcript_76234:79-798(-)